MPILPFNIGQDYMRGYPLPPPPPPHIHLLFSSLVDVLIGLFPFAAHLDTFPLSHVM